LHNQFEQAFPDPGQQALACTSFVNEFANAIPPAKAAVSIKAFAIFFFSMFVKSLKVRFHLFSHSSPRVLSLVDAKVGAFKGKING
jgi:hypothetical protein